MDKMTVLIADDHTPFRQGLRALLAASPEIELIGEAQTGAEVIELAAKLQPDVILMDIQMPDIQGIDATRRILHTSPHIAILIITMFADDDFIFAALRAGARGYLLKGAMKAEILRAIQAVARGEAIFSPAIAKRLLHFFSSFQSPSTPSEYAFPELTEREREILDLIAAHLNNQEIADRLRLSLKTVRNHVSNIFSKMQVVDRAQAILRAREKGLGNQNL